METSAVRRIQFCAGHRVYQHESKCANFHGHNYVAFFHARSKNGLDPIGRVIDFSVLKEKIGGWIDLNWDHGFIYFINDLLSVELFEKQLSKQKSFLMFDNPTAENMAEYLLKTICPMELDNYGIEVFKVILWETENCFAEVSL